MPEQEKSFNWWEVLGVGAGTVIGGAIGSVIPGVGTGYGAAFGAGIGGAISPGGFWNYEDAPAEALPQTSSAGVTAAALKEMEAASNIIRRETQTGIGAIRQRYGQAGTFQSGARGRAEDQFRQQGLSSLSSALAGIELEAVRARQSGAANTIALQMQEAQFAWQKRQMENQMLTDLISTALPFFMSKSETATPSLNPLDVYNEAGIDPMVGMSGGQFQPASPYETGHAQALLQDPRIPSDPYSLF